MMMIRVVVDMCGISSGRAILQERCPSVPAAGLLALGEQAVEVVRAKDHPPEGKAAGSPGR